MRAHRRRPARASPAPQIGGDGVELAPVAPIDLVSRIQRIEGDLSLAERRVAAAVAADYEATTRMTIGDLAERAGVSQPSVTRFCRSVGCVSFSEFKVRLATTLTVAAVYLRTDRVFDDDVGQLAQVVMLRASNAIRDCLEKLDTAAVRHAIAAIAACSRLDIYGQGGGSASIAEDAKLRFFRLGLPVCAYADGCQQRMSAATLRPKDVAFAVSNSGRSEPVIGAVEIAKSYGATTIALTRPNTPLAAAAQVVIPVVTPEHVNALMPTASRYAHMAIVDTIATGVASEMGSRSREALRRVRYTLANIGVAIASPSSDPTPLMKTEPQE
ncbi:MAG: MurR/RpiR family transcriptional regulator [Hyphomicrobiales bacterium]|nr:MurR/RpiR family transcriptional regulator [Hyphomicrobiales bacterium]